MEMKTTNSVDRTSSFQGFSNKLDPIQGNEQGQGPNMETRNEHFKRKAHETSMME